MFQIIVSFLVLTWNYYLFAIIAKGKTRIFAGMVFVLWVGIFSLSVNDYHNAHKAAAVQVKK